MSKIGIPVVVFVLVLTGFGLFWYQRKSKKLDLDNEFSKTPASVTSSTTASVEQLHNEFRNFDPTKTPLMDPQMVAWNSQTNLQPRYMAEGELPHLLPPEKNYPIVQPPILADTMQKETIIVDNSDDILPDLPLILNDPPTIDPTTIDTTTIDPPTIDPPSIDPPFSDDTKPMIVVIEKPDYTDNPEN
ncbi:hypothetical protein HK103_005127 [Boothiomyces macroporosus]|uniref:Uncharacterized protein n=1 Tax=Boothiomyces macroporosus TaxID=261099 RepID=A0AAD5UII6_9FUNG|nr:hypothetical protein HK103_005127 [Boothiomyces macroporosus]